MYFNICLIISYIATDTVGVNCNDMKTLLANGVSTIFTNGKWTLINGARTLPRNPTGCIIGNLCLW